MTRDRFKLLILFFVLPGVVFGSVKVFLVPKKTEVDSVISSYSNVFEIPVSKSVSPTPPTPTRSPPTPTTKNNTDESGSTPDSSDNADTTEDTVVVSATPTVTPSITPSPTPDPTPTPDPCLLSDLSTYDTRILSDDPVLYLPFDSGLTCDRSVNNLDGEKYGTVSGTLMPNGDAALTFDGMSGFISVQDSDILSIPTTGKLTLETWMRPDTLTFPVFESTGYVHWLGKGETNNHEYHLRMYNLLNDENRPNRISGYAFNPTGGLGVGSYFQDTVSIGGWIHVVFVYNITDVDSSYPMGYTKIYKNGAQRDKDSLDSLSIVPTNGNAPLRIGTRDLKSFFQGAIGKVAVYNYEMTPYQVLQHYQTMVPPIPGTASFVQNVAKANTKSPGTTLPLQVSQKVSAGNTLIIRVLSDFTSGGPTISDSKGNVYTRDRSSPNSGNTMRASIFSSNVVTELNAGDVITVNTASVSGRVAVVDEFTGLLSSGVLDKTNGTSGSSTTPGSSISITTTTANELILGFVATEGSVEDTYSEDSLGQYVSLTREGTTGGVDDTNITINGGYKSVGEIGTYSYRPTIDPSRNWIDFVVGYKAQ